jgi:hypothetical protein
MKGGFVVSLSARPFFSRCNVAAFCRFHAASVPGIRRKTGRPRSKPDYLGEGSQECGSVFIKTGVSTHISPVPIQIRFDRGGNSGTRLCTAKNGAARARERVGFLHRGTTPAAGFSLQFFLRPAARSGRANVKNAALGAGAPGPRRPAAVPWLPGPKRTEHPGPAPRF